jgi:hypothetical protein
MTIRSNSQDHFTSELKWVYSDSVPKIVLKDTSQIITSCLHNMGSFATYKTKSIKVGENNIFIVMIDICSGIYCPFIEVFKEEKNQWHFITSSHANLLENLKVEVDTCQTKVIFKVKSNQIGELKFATLFRKDQK